ncbi:unnamed protein product [Parajaminaea phylloscopi]
MPASSPRVPSRRMWITAATTLALASVAAAAAVTTASPASNTSLLSRKSHHSPEAPWTDADARAQKTRDEWSSVVGWISIACWVIVYTPQLKENYDRKSGDGLSLAFVVIWLAGDALNLVGAWRQELLGTMIILAGYYTLCDIALIAQYYYYRKWHAYYHSAVTAEGQTSNVRTATETTPLVGTAKSSQENSRSQLQREVIKYLIAAGLVITTGVAAWAVQSHLEGDEGQAKRPEGPGWKWDAQIFGWLSAILYLVSRVPQIFKNRQTKCEGLSLALFLFAVAGNVTYVASILIKSTGRDYLVESSSWLVGSLGTVFLDFIVLYQFVAYKEAREALALQTDAEASA